MEKMSAGGGLYAILFLKLCILSSSKLINQSCILEDRNIGKCVATVYCPQSTTNTFKNVCDTGKVCCRVLEKIVSPSAQASPAAPTAPASSTAPNPPPQGTSSTSSPEWVSVTPVVVNPSTPGSGSSAGNGPPSGNAPPAGNAPPTGGAPSGGGTPPAGGAPPAGMQPSSGATPPSGGPPGGGPPPLMGSIVTDPNIPSKSLPLPPITTSDTIVVSAEDISNVVDIVDKKCNFYHSFLEQSSPVYTSKQSFTPMVMIYGGTNTAEREFPHMAALGFGEPNEKQWLCAGSLITENYVLTAAHCLSAPPLGEVRYVKLGNTILDQDTQNTQHLNVIGRTSHEQYDPRTQYNDIALLQLDHSVQITQYVMPICLFSSTNYEDKDLIATGWGKTEQGTVSMDLRKVGLELFTQTECQNAYSAVSKNQLPLGIQESIQLCAGSRTESRDTCQGDSGGPLQLRKNNRWYLIGITSIGIQCGNVNSPGVYTRVAYFVQWIQQKVWNK